MNCINCDISICDSLNLSVSSSTQITIAKLVKTKKDIPTIEAVKVNTQPGADEFLPLHFVLAWHMDKSHQQLRMTGTRLENT